MIRLKSVQSSLSFSPHLAFNSRPLWPMASSTGAVEHEVGAQVRTFQVHTFHLGIWVALCHRTCVVIASPAQVPAADYGRSSEEEVRFKGPSTHKCIKSLKEKAASRGAKAKSTAQDQHLKDAEQKSEKGETQEAKEEQSMKGKMGVEAAKEGEMEEGAKGTKEQDTKSHTAMTGSGTWEVVGEAGQDSVSKVQEPKDTEPQMPKSKPQVLSPVHCAQSQVEEEKSSDTRGNAQVTLATRDAWRQQGSAAGVARPVSKLSLFFFPKVSQPMSVETVGQSHLVLGAHFVLTRGH